MLKVLCRVLALVLFIAAVQPSLVAATGDPGDGTPPPPFDVFRVGMTTAEIEKAGAQKMEDGVWGHMGTWDGYKCGCMLNAPAGVVKQAVFGFELNTGLLGMLTAELSSRGLLPLAFDLSSTLEPELLNKKSQDELESLVVEKLAALADAGEGDIKIFYVAADVFEKAAQTDDEEALGKLMMENMIHVLKVDIDEEAIMLSIARGDDYSD